MIVSATVPISPKMEAALEWLWDVDGCATPDQCKIVGYSAATMHALYKRGLVDLRGFQTQFWCLTVIGEQRAER